MGDYTSMSGLLYAVPKYKTRGVARLFNEYDIDEDYQNNGPIAWDGTKVRSIIVRGLRFTSYDFRCGHSEYLADELQALGCTFELYEEPKYEWLGELHMFHPELGRLDTLCDADGEPLIPISMFREIQNEGGNIGIRYVKIRQRIGVVYLDTFYKKVNDA
jgi:hypothetical protein